MAEVWTNEPDPPKPHHYRRIYDAKGRSVARVYDPADAELIAQAPAMRELLRRIATHDPTLESSSGEARRLYRLAGGKRL